MGGDHCNTHQMKLTRFGRFCKNLSGVKLMGPCSTALASSCILFRLLLPDTDCLDVWSCLLFLDQTYSMSNLVIGIDVLSRPRMVRLRAWLEPQWQQKGKASMHVCFVKSSSGQDSVDKAHQKARSILYFERRGPHTYRTGSSRSKDLWTDSN